MNVSCSHRIARTHSPRAGAWRTALSTVLSSVLLLPAQAGDRGRTLADLSVEELMNESVTSVSKKHTTVNQSPAAVAVVMQDDIRRLGVTTIPEALRLVPGVDVARISANQWAVSSRGFNSQFARSLLVMMDGRTLYTPAFAGVFWDVADTVMEDIDRIEVIRGPGATLWGANAVNGVINILTKSARETQGLLLSTTEGSEERFSGTARYGGQLGQDFFYRAYVKRFVRDGLVDNTGADARDDWDMWQSGFRTDWLTSPENAFTFQGDYYTATTRQNHREIQFTPPFVREQLFEYDHHGVNVIGRWTHNFSPTSQLSLQAFFDHSLHEGRNSDETRDTTDLDFQHRFAVGARHDIVWGLGYRNNAEYKTSSVNLQWAAARHSAHFHTAFVQDEIALVRDALKLIAGVKFERHEVIGLETQPGLRLLWMPTAHQTLWAGASRAARTPSGFETGARLNNAVFQPAPSGPLMESARVGNPDLTSEELRAFELGYRFEPGSRWSLDLATFYNQYRDLIGSVPQPNRFEATPVPHILIPLLAANNDAANTWGAELAIQWRASDHWRLSADYSWLKTNMRLDKAREGDSPQHQAHLRSYLTLAPRWELNTSLSYVSQLFTSISRQHIPAYTQLDVGLTWRPTTSLELGVWGRNLLDGHHQEYASLQTSFRTEIPRSFLGRITWRY